MEINLGVEPFDIDFHPSQHLLSIVLVSGGLLLYRCSADLFPQRLMEIHAHTESCRAVRFINDGRAIVTGSSDHSILASDVETGGAIARLEDAHRHIINKIINLGESTIASGDDEGFIKVWDTRQRSCCSTFYAHTNYVSDMAFASDSMKLLGTSGDGSLSVCNLRRNKVQVRSEFSEYGLHSIAIMKNGRKIVCGGESGPMLLYSWGYFKDCSDRFVDLEVGSMLKLDEDRIISGSANGLINLVNILPNRIIQPIAEHSEIEGLAYSHDRKFLGSVGDEMLKIWNLDDILQQSENNSSSEAAAEDGYENEMDLDIKPHKSNKGSKREYSRTEHNNISSSNNFFSDL